MSESETPSAGGASTSSGGRARAGARSRPTARRKAASRPRTGSAGARARRTPRRKSGSEIERLLQALAKSASGAGARLVAASGTGARATRRAWTRVSGSSRRTIDRLAKQWSAMDAKRKAQLIAALIGALAAASAPIVRSRLKKR